MLDTAKLQQLAASGLIDRDSAGTVFRITNFTDSGSDITMDQYLETDIQFRLLPKQLREAAMNEHLAEIFSLNSDRFVSNSVWNGDKFVYIHDHCIVSEEAGGITEFRPSRLFGNRIAIDACNNIYINANAKTVAVYNDGCLAKLMPGQVVCTEPITGHPVISSRPVSGLQYAISGNSIIGFSDTILPYDVKTGETLNLSESDVAFFAVRSLLLSGIANADKLYEEPASDYVSVIRLLSTIKGDVSSQFIERLEECKAAMYDSFVVEEMISAMHSTDFLPLSQEKLVIKLFNVVTRLRRNFIYATGDFRCSLHQYKEMAEHKQKTLLIEEEMNSAVRPIDKSVRIVYSLCE